MLFSTGCGGHLVLHSRNHCRLIEESPPDWKLQRHGASHPINQVIEGALVMGLVSDTIARRLHVHALQTMCSPMILLEKISLQKHPTRCKGLRKVVDPVDINMNIIGLLH